MPPRTIWGEVRTVSGFVKTHRLNFCRRPCLAGRFDQGQQTVDRRGPVFPLAREDTDAVDQYLKLSVSVSNLRLDTVLRFKFALQAPGQASFVASNQAATNLDFSVLVHMFERGCNGASREN